LNILQSPFLLLLLLLLLQQQQQQQQQEVIKNEEVLQPQQPMYFLTSSPYLEKGKQLDNMKKKKIYNPISFFLLLLLLRLHTQFQEIGDINNKSYHV
jgi:hypothetical protein